ncbi:DUF2490 domain-containing protein [Flagellimonas sp. 2504JD4-2]
MPCKQTLVVLAFNLLFFPGHLYPQDLTHLGFLPRINYTTPISEKISLNGSFFSEIDLVDDYLEEVLIPKKVLNLTFIAGLSFKLNSRSHLTSGYLFRLIDPFKGDIRLEHRLIQQYVHISHWGSIRIRNHLRAEERLIESTSGSGAFNGIIRLSYSLGWDLPLQGKHLNANEFYLNSISSYFVQPTKPRTAFNNLNEFYLGLGYNSTKFGRFEIGPEAKISVMNISKDLNALFFIDIIWYPK